MEARVGRTGRGGLKLSVVIPVYNERDSLDALLGQLTSVLRGINYEIIFVDDGSTDGSARLLNQLWLKNPRVKVVRFARNFGKSLALAVGFKESRGEIIVTMDADLQDDPAEIPRLVTAIEEGYDLVSGWKKQRRDPLSKTLPSKVFNRITAWFTGIDLHDFNSGFKAYRRELLPTLQVYGEQHRYIPALAYWKGFRVTEIPVQHHPRRYGRSKFGARRFLSGLLDLLTVLFLTRFKQKPLHLFGIIGLLCLIPGVAINLYLTYLRISGEPIGTRPLLQLGILLLLMGIQFLGIGLLGEMITLSASREREEEPIYQVYEVASRLKSSEEITSYSITSDVEL